MKHTFGRLPKTRDDRDYQLKRFLPPDWRDRLAQFKAEKKSVLWQPVIYTDQDGFSHCTTFTDADFQNTPPVVAELLIDNDTAHAWYYQMMEFLGRPGDEGGAEMRELMDYMLKVQKRIDAYAWAKEQEEIEYWLAFEGPVINGTVWLSHMVLDQAGFVDVSGSLEGYHAWSYVGWDSATEVYTGLNHWIDMQLFKVSPEGAAALWQENGEFIMTPELPRTPQPTPVPNGCDKVKAAWDAVLGTFRPRTAEGKRWQRAMQAGRKELE